MLVDINQLEATEKAHNAWLRTIEDGVHTYDIFKEGVSTQKVGTKEFAEAVVARLGQKPEKLKAVTYSAVEEDVTSERKPIYTTPTPQKKELVGVDVFIDGFNGKFTGVGDELGKLVEKANGDGLVLQSINSRGTKVYPGGLSDTFTIDHWRCRFLAEAGEGNKIEYKQIISLLQRFAENNLDAIKTENLYNFDGEKGYSA